MTCSELGMAVRNATVGAKPILGLGNATRRKWHTDQRLVPALQP